MMFVAPGSGSPGGVAFTTYSPLAFLLMLISYIFPPGLCR
jgi:hypothetical protein